MPPKAAKMSQTFDQAIHDETAFTCYSARNTSIEELEDLILQINEMKDKTQYTRSDKNKFQSLKSETNELKSLIKKENKEFCTAIGRLNPNISNEEKYNKDQKSVRQCIKSLDNAMLDLEVKLEDENIIPTRSIMESPAATSDIATILLQMSKQQERQDNAVCILKCILEFSTAC